MEEKQVCCCGSGVWTRVIGWFQLVVSIIGIIFVAILLVGVISASSVELENASGQKLSLEQKEAIDLAFYVAAVTSGFFLFLLVANLVMAILLLTGSYNNNPRQLHIWIIVTVLVLILLLVSSVMQCFYGAELGPNIVSIILTLLIHGFCIWVVNTHKNEIEASLPPAYPAMKA